MTSATATVQPLVVPRAPAIPGLLFRRFRGKVDYAAMHDVIEGSKEVDGLERADTVEDIARNYRHLTNCDPYRDMVFAQISGGPEEVIGYSRVWWQQEMKGDRVYQHFAFLLPAWRGVGIRRAMLHHNERRLAELAADHDVEGQKLYEAWAADTEQHWSSLLLRNRYKEVRVSYEMVRPNLHDIPQRALPAGIRVRGICPEHVEQVWQAAHEAFQDHWGETEWQPQWLEEWKESPTFDPNLWQVAWDGDQVAGGVLNFIDKKENEEYDRRRGYTEGIFVRRPWRRQGVAKALIARSLHMHRDLGMEEAALGVDSENPNGALQLYRSMGFRAVKSHTNYRKPVHTLESVHALR